MRAAEAEPLLLQTAAAALQIVWLGSHDISNCRGNATGLRQMSAQARPTACLHALARIAACVESVTSPACKPVS
jgi:hypothetical protein